MNFALRPRLGNHRAMILPLLAGMVLSASVVTAQVADQAAVDEAGKDPSDWAEKETGIPVTDRLTIEKCGSCHAPDDKGNLTRISWIRATPEGWSQTIKRMVKLNGLAITPEEARAVVKYLGTWHGLAPDEAKPVMYFAERRVQDETIIPNENLRTSCAGCHAFAQPMSSRRSHREWALLQNMHKALYSQAEFQLNRPADEQPADNKPPKKPLTQGQIALAWLSKEADLGSAAWAQWRPRIRTPRLGGKWIISASLRGHGRFVGTMTITPSGDDFTTTTTLRSLDTGATSTRTGKGLVYAGYSWRGTSGGGQSAKPDDITGALRETMWFSPDQTFAEGRWYWGEYHEFGLDVKMTRATGGPVIAAVSPSAVKIGAKGTEVHIYGDALPSALSADDLDFGSGVTVRKVVTLSPSEAVATVDVSADAIAGLHDVAVNGVTLTKALPVYGSIDYLKVVPETSLAHLGGIKYGKGYEQFEAVAWSNGADGKPNTGPDTGDDFPVMPIAADWTMGEFPTVTYDDDVKYVGTLGTAGFFTPNVEGPNPERRFSRNNYGEVWVVATARTLKDKLGKPLSARAYLVTTVPTYRRWDQPEVSQ
ncbi:quinohemoprotein amine dehydrogenase [Novosphingobium sp. CF614]|uniref:quinohemoprotein amine dehydrogenase subunit alpha n=1 Tax=Novosphingobium sp. CF614 TaxID=1884364 RepID=UPI0008E5E5A2|nr:quinohemoprotein amine dehydrogenase subunit alpha [Novosphingobium sp. CF614]SFF91573.1 quinohemoprotein amine dehydrogenase [Novosphingobium sp. CF614]